MLEARKVLSTPVHKIRSLLLQQGEVVKNVFVTVHKAATLHAILAKPPSKCTHPNYIRYGLSTHPSAQRLPINAPISPRRNLLRSFDLSSALFEMAVLEGFASFHPLKLIVQFPERTLRLV